MNCEILYEKIIPAYNKTIRDIIERERANSPFLNTEKSENPPGLIEWSNDLKTYLYEPISMAYSFAGFKHFDIILFIGQIVFWFDKFFNKYLFNTLSVVTEINFYCR